ncbi:MAG TPA: hypothetical protein VGO89_20880, partial [Streptomyces sp.]|nr:hypothetical protein [Streptomyces sp.]
MVQRADAALIGYLAGHYDRVRLVLRGVSDTDAALAALNKAADAVWRIPNPYEPSSGLPNWCAASIEDGLPVLHLDAKDGAGHIDQIAAAILNTLDAEGVGGRIVPFPHPDQTPDETGRPPVPMASRRAPIRPRAREVSPGDLGLAVSDYGFLYSEGIRAMLSPLLEPWSLVGYETCFAMYATREAATDFGRRIRKEGSTGEPPRLWPLREHRSGMPLAELCTQMGATYEELRLALEKMERIGELVMWQSDGGIAMIGLTDKGQLAMDGHLRQKAAKDLVVLEDIRPEQ